MFQSSRNLFHDFFFSREVSQYRDDMSFQVASLFTWITVDFFKPSVGHRVEQRRCQRRWSMMPKDRAKIRCRRAVKRRLETRRISSFNFAGTIQFPGSAVKERLDISLLFFLPSSPLSSLHIYIYIYIKSSVIAARNPALFGARGRNGRADPK